jgi:hypothetical protein
MVVVTSMPAAGVVNARLPLLEIAAIAAAGIALVICLDAPVLIWAFVLGLTAARKNLRTLGVDLVLWDRPRVVTVPLRRRRRSSSP